MPTSRPARRRAVGSSIAVVAALGFGAAQVATATLAPRPDGIETVAESATALAKARRLNLPSGTPTTDPDKPIFPMATEPKCQSLNNYGDARSGHVHQGLDIMGTLGQEVYAAVDGTLGGQFVFEGTGTSGNVWHLTSNVTTTYYVYMHLDGFTLGLANGSKVKQGQVIAYVGSTGNYNEANTHLHFEVHPTGSRTVTVDPLTVLTIPPNC